MSVDPNIARFETMLEKGMDNPMLRLTLGTAYWKKKQLPEAIEHLEQAVEQKPDYSAAWKILARARMEDGRLADAKEAFEKGLQAAVANGDKQSEKEIGVFSKRLDKMLNERDKI